MNNSQRKVFAETAVEIIEEKLARFKSMDAEVEAEVREELGWNELDSERRRLLQRIQEIVDVCREMGFARSGTIIDGPAKGLHEQGLEEKLGSSVEELEERLRGIKAEVWALDDVADAMALIAELRGEGE